MQRITDEIWVCLGPADNHRLRFGLACGVEKDRTLFRFDPGDAPERPIADGAVVQIYYNGEEGFLLQPATVVSHEDEEEGRIYRFEFVGEAANAEDRASTRVEIAGEQIPATIGDDEPCRITDASPAGISVVCGSIYMRGRMVSLSFEVEGEIFTGVARVQSLRPGANGNRHGLRCVSETGSGNLIAGLRRLIAASPRQHFRLSRAG